MGILGCVFIDNEIHESGVTKCTTGEAWSAFSWHHSSVIISLSKGRMATNSQWMDSVPLNVQTNFYVRSYITFVHWMPLEHIGSNTKWNGVHIRSLQWHNVVSNHRQLNCVFYSLNLLIGILIWWFSGLNLSFPGIMGLPDLVTFICTEGYGLHTCNVFGNDAHHVIRCRTSCTR